MNKNIMKYYEALTSGDYIQVKRELKNNRITAFGNSECFCAMGLACEVYRQENPDDAWWRDETFVLRSDGTVTSRKELEWTQAAPKAVLDWLGISDVDQTCLIELNDCNDYSFIEIAEWISADSWDRYYPVNLEHFHPGYDNDELE